ETVSLRRSPDRRAIDIDGVVQLQGRQVPYVIERSRRAKRVRFIIGPQVRVRVVAPEYDDLGDIQKLLEPYAPWIMRHLTGAEEAAAHPPVMPSSGDAVPFRGGNVRLAIAPAAHAHGLLENGTLRLSVPGGWDAVGVLSAWYWAEARRVLRHRADHWAALMEVRPGRVTVRDQRTRWGSCSSQGNLNFSWRLVLAPEVVLDYVVIHELAHLVHPNHQPAFWALVERWCPDMERHRRWLRRHGSELAAVGADWGWSR
ncbi:MAG: M48 family metallopeptidase, partial [Chloroflexota bacterium]|nr:M48 family metallopeptidase [Chloroflexota bacterium]